MIEELERPDKPRNSIKNNNGMKRIYLIDKSRHHYTMIIYDTLSGDYKIRDQLRLTVYISIHVEVKWCRTEFGNPRPAKQFFMARTKVVNFCVLFLFNKFFTQFSILFNYFFFINKIVIII
jgi:hypothetical protein